MCIRDRTDSNSKLFFKSDAVVFVKYKTDDYKVVTGKDVANSVSYTHLDVYKRQTIYGMKRTELFQCFQNFLRFFEKISEWMGSVSYTHLV